MTEYAVSTNLISWAPAHAETPLFGWPTSDPEADVVKQMSLGDVFVPKFSQNPEYRRGGGQVEYQRGVCDVLGLDSPGLAKAKRPARSTLEARMPTLGKFGFDVALVRELAASAKPIVIAATRGGVGLDIEDPDVGNLHFSLAELTADEHCQTVDIDRTLTTATERAHLSKLGSAALAERLRSGGIPMLVAADEMMEILRTRRRKDAQECEEGYALMYAAIDAARAGLVDPLPEHLLRALLPHYLPGGSHEDYASAVAWAKDRLYPGVAMLTIREGGARPDDYVVQAFEREPRYADDGVWQTLVNNVTPIGCFQLGVTGYHNGQTADEPAEMEDAIEAFSHPPNTCTGQRAGHQPLTRWRPSRKRAVRLPARAQPRRRLSRHT